MAQGITPNDHPFATREDIRRLEDRIAELVRLLDNVIRDQKTQFVRIAQLQADLDLIRGAWNQLKPVIATTETMRGAEPSATGSHDTGPKRRKTARKRQ